MESSTRKQNNRIGRILEKERQTGDNLTKQELEFHLASDFSTAIFNT